MGSRRLVAAVVGCAVAVGLSASSVDVACPEGSAWAKPKAKKRVSRCMRYTQERGADEQSVDITLRNRCGYPVTCSLEWKVSCDADASDTSPREGARVLRLDRGERGATNASAAACGDDGWAVADIRWLCEPV